MDRSNEHFSTPIQNRSKYLGFKRNSSIQKEIARKGTTPITAGSIMTRSNRQQPQTDGKLKRDTVTSPGTPSTSSLLQRECVSTNCRPYRLSLSKRMREKMTKKRLEFHVANEIEKEELELRISQKQEREDNCEMKNQEHSPEKSKSDLSILENHSETSEQNKDEKVCDTVFPGLKPEEMSRDQLLTQIEKLRNDLKSRQYHARKKQELQEAINTWITGFNTTLRDLQNKITPHYDIETLLEYLKIPKEMIKYVND